MDSLIIKNADIYTMEPDDEKNNAACIVIEGNKIVYVGDLDGSEKFIKADTKIIDAEGKMVLPGLIDAHAHPIFTPFFNGIDFTTEMDLSEILKAVKKYISENPQKDCYFGLGYLEDNLTHETYRKEVLDEVCPDKPILLMGSTMHEGWCNSKALKMAGIDSNYPDPSPNEQFFHRDEDGEPTGRLCDLEPFEIIADDVKPYDGSKAKEILAELLNSYKKLGITSVADCGVFSPAGEAEAFQNVKTLEDSGKLTCRIFGTCGLNSRKQIECVIQHLKELNRKYNSDKFQIRTLKILQDGCIEARNASCFEDYKDYGEKRPPLIEGEDLKKLFLNVAKAGFDIHLHALGDKAIFETLDAARTVREAGYSDMRITNAHTHIVRDEDMHMFGDYNVIVNSTPQWFIWRQCNIDALGEEKAEKLLRMKSAIDAGAVFTIGSDYPSDECGYEPFKAVEMAVTRQLFGRRDDLVLKPEDERLTIDEALKALTINAAYQVHMQDKLGSIKEGKYADIIILEDNLYDVDTYDIHNVEISMTISDGEVVYERKNNQR